MLIRTRKASLLTIAVGMALAYGCRKDDGEVVDDDDDFMGPLGGEPGDGDSEWPTGGADSSGGSSMGGDGSGGDASGGTSSGGSSSGGSSMGGMGGDGQVPVPLVTVHSNETGAGQIVSIAAADGTWLRRALTNDDGVAEIEDFPEGGSVTILDSDTEPYTVLGVMPGDVLYPIGRGGQTSTNVGTHTHSVDNVSTESESHHQFFSCSGSTSHSAFSPRTLGPNDVTSRCLTSSGNLNWLLLATLGEDNVAYDYGLEVPLGDGTVSTSTSTASWKTDFFELTLEFENATDEVLETRLSQSAWTEGRSYGWGSSYEEMTAGMSVGSHTWFVPPSFAEVHNISWSVSFGQNDVGYLRQVATLNGSENHVFRATSSDMDVDFSVTHDLQGRDVSFDFASGNLCSGSVPMTGIDGYLYGRDGTAEIEWYIEGPPTATWILPEMDPMFPSDLWQPDEYGTISAEFDASYVSTISDPLERVDGSPEFLRGLSNDEEGERCRASFELFLKGGG